MKDLSTSDPPRPSNLFVTAQSKSLPPKVTPLPGILAGDISKG